MRRMLVSLSLLLTLVAPREALALAQGFTGALAVQIATLAPVAIPGAGTLVINGSSGPGHLTALSFAASPFAISGFVLPVTDPGVFPIAGVAVTAHNGAASFGGYGGAGFGGTMSINGIAKVCLYGACGSSNNISNLAVPLSVVGVGGAVTVMGAVNLTVVGAPWTTGTAAIGTITLMGGVSPLSNTAAPGGGVTLVTPIFISTNIGAFSVVPAFGIMGFNFIPEPGTIALLGSGIAALAAFGRSRMRS